MCRRRSFAILKDGECISFWGKNSTNMLEDIYECTDGSDTIVDLNDLTTFPEEWLEKTADELNEMCRVEAGGILFYMLYLQSGVNWCGQEKRIERYLWQLADNWRDHLEDTEVNRRWFMKWLFRFIDETENMC